MAHYVLSERRAVLPAKTRAASSPRAGTARQAPLSLSQQVSKPHGNPDANRMLCDVSNPQGNPRRTASQLPFTLGVCSRN